MGCTHTEWSKKSYYSKFYNILEKSNKAFYQVVFLDVCQSHEITLIVGFNIKKNSCVGKPSNGLLFLWEKELAAAQFKLTELAIIKFVKKLFYLETKFISKFKKRKIESWRVLTIYILNFLRVITIFFV